MARCVLTPQDVRRGECGAGEDVFVCVCVCVRVCVERSVVTHTFTSCVYMRAYMMPMRACVHAGEDSGACVARGVVARQGHRARC